jgi:glycosyltransferase involved in cell wall biosynthesis
MKKILLTLYKNRSHSLYKQFISNPPEGYQYYVLDDFFDEFIFEGSQNFFIEIVRKVKRNKVIIDVAIKNNIDIIYCCDGILLFNSPIPWIVDLEHVTGLISNNYKLWKFGKKIIPFLLKQKNLRYLIPWTEAGGDALRCNFKLSKGVLKKILPVYLCLENIAEYADIEKRRIPHDVFTIIFVTSINYNGENEFYAKGGRMVIRVFDELRKIIPITLLLRGRLPAEFHYLKDDLFVEIYEDSLPYDKFQELFLRADVFFFPGYQSPGMAFLDAMNYNLPIVSTDVFSNSEMVRDGWNGFLINFPSTNIAFYLNEEFNIKGVPSGVRAREDKIDKAMISDFVEKIALLQGNASLLKDMSVNSKKLLQTKFSLAKRNSQLKIIYDKITNNHL